MRLGGGNGWRALVAIAALVAATLAAVLAPAGAAAVDSDLKHAFAFRVGASNGYSIVAVAGNERADGRGEIVLLVRHKMEGVIYVAPALLTATSVEADLGALGRVSLQVTPSGHKKKLRRSCGEEPETVSFEPQRFSGSFEFHGEEGYTEATSTAPPEYTRFFYGFGCAAYTQGEVGASSLPGARLRLHARRGAFRLNLQANKNRPGARTRFEVTTREVRGEIEIHRARTLWAGSDAFAFDPRLDTATLAPPAPFAGNATFRRNAAPANRWTGDLTVDLPGRSAIPLTGPGIEATLRPACFHEGEGRFRC